MKKLSETERILAEICVSLDIPAEYLKTDFQGRANYESLLAQRKNRGESWQE